MPYDSAWRRAANFKLIDLIVRWHVEIATSSSGRAECGEYREDTGAEGKCERNRPPESWRPKLGALTSSRHVPWSGTIAPSRRLLGQHRLPYRRGISQSPAGPRRKLPSWACAHGSREPIQQT